MSMAVLLWRISPLRWSLMFSSLCDEFEAFLHLADDSFSIPHCHDKGAFSLEEGQSIFLWVLEMDFDEAAPIPCSRVDAYISIGLEYVDPSGMFMSRSLSIHAALISRRLSFLYSPLNLMVMWNPSVRPVS